MKDYEIFISHSTRDSELVTKLVEAIETAGYRCWVSPRDIRAGIPYAHAIMEGLDACKVFVVVLTDNSVKSEHVLNEIDNAQNTGKHIIPLRRRDDGLELPGEFKYYLSRTQHVFIDGNNFTGIIAKMGLAPKQPQAPVEKPQANEVTVDEIAKKGLAHLDTKNYSLALPLLIEEAERGNIEAMAAVGRIYDEGLGVKRDYNKAQEWYTKAAEAGYTAVYFRLSELLSTASGSASYCNKSDTAKKLDLLSDMWLQKAAESGDANAQYTIGFRSMYAMPELAMSWLEKAADGGSSRAKYELGGIYYRGSIGLNSSFVKPDHAKAADYYIEFINAGDMPKHLQYEYYGIAEYYLGLIFRFGNYGAAANLKKSIDFFLQAASHGHEASILELGKAYLNGTWGCEKNLKEAAKWLVKVSESHIPSVKKEVRDILNSNLKLRILAMLK